MSPLFISWMYPINQVVLRNMAGLGGEEKEKGHTGTLCQCEAVTRHGSLGSAWPWAELSEINFHKFSRQETRFIFKRRSVSAAIDRRDQQFAWWRGSNVDCEFWKSIAPCFLPSFQATSKSWPQEEEPQVTSQVRIPPAIAFYARIFSHVPESVLYFIYSTYTLEDKAKRVLCYLWELNRRTISGLFCPVTLICCFCATLMISTVKHLSIGCYLGTRSFGSISMTDYD